MNKMILALLLCCAAAPLTAADCAKNSDACSAGQRKLSPFMEAVKAVESTAAAQPAPVPAAAPAKRRAKPAEAPAPAPVAVSSAAAAPEAQAPVPAGASSPLWLIFVGALLAGLYFYLNAPGRRKGRR